VNKPHTNHTTWLAALLLLATAVLLVVPALAQQPKVYRAGNAWVEETTGSLAAARTLAVKVSAGGNLQVQGTQQQGITYTIRKRAYTSSESDARRLFEQLRVTANRAGDMAVIKTDSFGRVRNVSADVQIETPRSLELAKLETGGGNIHAAALNGHVDANTGGGNIVLDDIGSGISAISGGGNVDVGASSGDLNVHTGGGNIHIASAKGRVVTESGGGNIVIGAGAQTVNVQTGGGAIEVKNCLGEIKAQSGGGSLDLGQIGGRAYLETGGGSIRLTSASGPVVASTGGGAIQLWGLSQGAKVETGGGGITAEFVPGNFTGSSLETPAGDIVVYLSPNLKANIRASVELARGKSGITSDFPEVKVTTEGGQWGPKSMYAEGSLNGGGPTLTLRTNVGSIQIRRAKR
jgi:hypothetical protein